MPQYRYTAADARGRTVRGTADAADPAALYRQLHGQGLYMTQAKPARTAADRPLRAGQLAELCRSLGTLLEAGMPLAQAFRVMADEHGIGARERALYTTLQDALFRGVPLSQAMAQCTPAFPPLLIAMVRSSEGSGRLDRCFLRMSAYYAREHKINRQVGSSLLYPFLLVLLLCAVIILLNALVLPQFKPLFAQMETLPALTRLMFAVSDRIAACWPLLLLVLAGLWPVSRLLLAQPALRQAWDRFLLYAPLVGAANRKRCTARFARTLSDLYAAGVPIADALVAARDAVGNAYLARQFGDVLRILQDGGRLSDALAPVDGFAPALAAAIAVGEESGRLDELLTSVSDSLDQEAEAADKRLLSLLEPLLILLMGVLVGGMVAAVMLPLYNSYSALGTF